MHEGAGGVKRGQTKLEKNLHHDKWRKREGIKRELRDIPRVQYEEYEASWDQEIQAKKFCIAVAVWRDQQKTWLVQYEFHPLPQL